MAKVHSEISMFMQTLFTMDSVGRNINCIVEHGKCRMGNTRDVCIGSGIICGGTWEVH